MLALELLLSKVCTAEVPIANETGWAMGRKENNNLTCLEELYSVCLGFANTDQPSQKRCAFMTSFSGP